MICPAAAEPTAVPTEIDGVSQAMPSVSRPGMACRSMRLKPVISRGESSSPQTIMTMASATSPGTSQNEAVPAAVATTVTANRRRSGERQALIRTRDRPPRCPGHIRRG